MIANISGSFLFIAVGGIGGAWVGLWALGLKDPEARNKSYPLVIVGACGMFWLATKLGLIW